MTKKLDGEYDGHWEIDNYAYRHAEIENVDGMKAPAIHVYDLEFNNPDSVMSVSVKGPAFLVPAASLYYHMLVDVIGEYELLRKFYPDIKIVFCSNDKFYELNQHRNVFKSKFIDEILDIYGSRNYILDLRKMNVHFNHVIHFANRTMWSQDRIVPLAIQDSLGDFDRDLCIDRRKDLISFVRNKLLPYSTPRNTPKKIYSARINLNNPDTVRNDIRSYADEIKIIEYFKNKGFEIVNLSGMSLFEQISLFANASEIAGIAGTNLLNSIFANQGAKVYQIHVTNLWAYNLFDQYFDAVGLDVININREYTRAMNLDGLTHAPIEVVLEDLDKKYINS